MLTRQELDHFRKLLAAERDAINSRRAERSRDSQETVRDESGVGDSADQGTRLDDLDVEADEDALDRVTLEEIEQALDRIKNGTYGVSEVSGKQIPKARLEAVPWATTLVDEPEPET